MMALHRKGNKEKRARELRGQLMLQIAAGRYFRPGVPIGEHVHRRTLHTNGWLIDDSPVELPVGTITGGTERDDVSTAMIEAVDRLEKNRPDGSDEFMIATGGDELVDDIAYVLTFVLNTTFSRDVDLVRRLVPREGTTGRHRAAAVLFPRLFEPRQVVQPEEMNDVRQFMVALIELHRDDFARVMRVVRSAVDATRRALDDPTGAYTDLVAALESLSNDDLTTPTTWDRYDGRKRKIFDAVLADFDPGRRDQVRAAVLEADRAGLKRRFVASTMSRIVPEYYRSEAVGARVPPQSADIEHMLGIAYDVRSRRSHVLQDLGQEAWVFSDGAEIAFEPSFERIFTLAGLWRLVRHVVRQYVAMAPKIDPEPWDYRMALPGIINAQLAPQYWVGRDIDAAHAFERLNGVAEALITWHANSRSSNSGFSLVEVAAKIEQVVPAMPDTDSRTALIAIHRLWHEWSDPGSHTSDALAFTETYEPFLLEPTPIAFTVAVLSDFSPRDWSMQEWSKMAAARRTDRFAGKGAPLPAKIDALLQLEAADRLEAEGRHDEALPFASNAVEEVPGNEMLLAWETRLIAGEHDPAFDVYSFLFDRAHPDDRDPAVASRDAESGVPTA